MVFVPGMGKRSFLVVAGIYCVLYGAFLLSDFIFQCLPEEIRKKFTGKMTLPMPALLSTLMPFMNLKIRRRKNILDPENAKKVVLQKTTFPKNCKKIFFFPVRCRPVPSNCTMNSQISIKYIQSPFLQSLQKNYISVLFAGKPRPNSFLF